MKRENRYLVLKRDDIKKHLTASAREELDLILYELAKGRSLEGKKHTNYVVVAEDWPMYEQTCSAIEQWVDGMTKDSNE